MKSGDLLEKQTLRPHPDLPNQDLLCNKLPGDSWAHQGLRSTGLKDEWDSGVGAGGGGRGKAGRPGSRLLVGRHWHFEMVKEGQYGSDRGQLPNEAGGISREALVLGVAMGLG